MSEETKPVYGVRTGPVCSCGHEAKKHLWFSGLCLEDCPCVEYQSPSVIDCGGTGDSTEGRSAVDCPECMGVK